MMKEIPRDKKVEIAAEAIARSELTEKGKLECVWPRDWGQMEVAKFRIMAHAALNAVGYFQ